VYYQAPVQDAWPEDLAKQKVDEAVALARTADVTVLAFGEAYNMAGENASRASLDLPGLQQQLLEKITATGKPVILVLIGGRPLNVTWAAEHTSAILAAWYPGTAGGDAVADILFGDANPTAKLPVTWPRSVGQVPMYYAHNITMSPRFAERRYWDDQSIPLYPFGFGLSYSSYAISNLELSSPEVKHKGEIDIAVDVQNESGRAGAETVQLYIHQRAGSTARPVRELKGFQQVALGPHQRKTVHFKLTGADLRYWSTAAKAWVLEDGDFDVWVGDSSVASLGGTFRVVP
jgi:beta-glucosidase